MENERVSKLRYFRTALVRQMFSCPYIFCIICALFLSYITPYLIDIINQTMSMMPDVADAFMIGGNYNVGVVSVPTLDLSLMENSDVLLKGVLSGTFAQLIVSVTAAAAVSSEFSCGYIKFAIMRGAGRVKIFLKSIAAAAIISVPISAAYIFGISASLAVDGKLLLTDNFNTLIIIFTQAIMLCAVAVCSAVIAVIIGNNSSVVVCVLGVLTLPLIPGYIKAFTMNKIDISSWLVVTKLVVSSTMNKSDILICLIISAATIAVFGSVGCLYFRSVNYK